jgi:hypothetical protein
MFAVLAQAAQQPAATPAPAPAAPPPAAGPADGVANLFETVTSLFSSVDMLAQPRDLVTHLQALSVVWAVVFIVVGMLCMFSGARHYKAVVISLAFLIGLFTGYWIGQKIDAPQYVIAGCFAILLAVLAYPLMKYAVAAFGALSGAFIGANLWVGLAQAINKGNAGAMPGEAYWIGALIGLIVCGMLAFILFKFSVVMFTSVSGATVAVLGVLCLLLSIPAVRGGIVDGLADSQIVIPLLVFVPAMIALVLQQSWTPELAGAQGGSGGSGGGQPRKA